MIMTVLLSNKNLSTKNNNGFNKIILLLVLKRNEGEGLRDV